MERAKRAAEYGHAWMVRFLRTVHAIVGLFLSTCLGYLYYVVLTGTELTRYVWGAITALVTELIVFLAFGKDCPLSIWQRKYGDEKGLIQLLLPAKLARKAFPVMLGTGAVAVLLIVGRALR